MPKQIHILLAFVVALMSLVMGCGSGDDATLTKAEFIKKADAICKRTNETQRGEVTAYVKANPEAVQGLTREATIEKLVVAILLPSVLKEAEEIEALGAPSGDEKKVEDFIAGIEEAVKKAEKDPGALAATYGGPFQVPNKMGREYGFQSCDEIT